MSTGYGLARLSQGISAGLNDVEARRRIQENEKRRDVQWEQGQQDRAHNLERQGIQENRQDTEYQQNQEQAQRKRDGLEAIRSWQATGDPAPVVSYLNKYSRDGVSHALIKNDDGTYTGQMIIDGKVEKGKKYTEDQIGQYVMMMTAANPRNYQQQQMQAEQDAKAETQKQSAETAKLEREYQLKGGLEKIKGGYQLEKQRIANAGKGSEGGKVPDYLKELETMSTKHYSTLSKDGLFAGFNEPSKARMKDYHLALADAIYQDSDNPNVATAAKNASDRIRAIEQMASKEVDAQIEAGKIDKKQKQDYVADRVSQYVQREIDQISQKAGGGSQAGMAAGGAPEFDAFLAEAKRRGKSRGMMDTDLNSPEFMDEIQKTYDEIYGGA